jgi:hypothetical protein
LRFVVADATAGEDCTLALVLVSCFQTLTTACNIDLLWEFAVVSKFVLLCFFVKLVSPVIVAELKLSIKAGRQSPFV